MQSLSKGLAIAQGLGGKLLANIALLWGDVRAFFYGMRVAWISVASGVLGLLLFLTAPQAQDLFLDVRGSFTIGIPFWIAFYAGILFFWVLPVYVSARWILSSLEVDASLDQDVRPVKTWVVRFLPPLLAMLCLAAVLVGQLLSLTNAPAPVDEFSAAKLEEIKSQLAVSCPSGEGITCLLQYAGLQSKVWLYELSETVGAENVILVIYAVVSLIPIFFLFVWLCFYASKRVPYFGRCFLALLSLWAFVELREIWQYLSIYSVFALFEKWALYFFWAALPAAVSLAPWRWFRIVVKALWWLGTGVLIAIVLLGAAVLLGGFVQNELAAPLGLGHLSVLPPFTVAVAYLTWWVLRPQTENFMRFLRAKLHLPFAPERLAMTAGRLVTFLFYAVLAISGLFILAISIFHPVEVSNHIYRALLVPIFLGVLVPALTWISRLSIKIHAPIILLLVVTLAVLNLSGSGINNVRTVAKSGLRPTLDESVERWARVNGCTPSTESAASYRNCPPPVIVAAAGGASRAAFLTATVIGKVMDSRPSVGAELPPFGKQLFAISGVSGGSLGAVVTYAAMADSQLLSVQTGVKGVPPCKPDARDTEWFAPHIDASRKVRDPAKNWRDCLQLILAGDFLSPVFVSQISDDLLGLSRRGDRAVILEHAWERRYAHITGQPIAQERSTLERSLVDLRNQVLGSSSTAWLPVLLLNGTSVSTGRRIVGSDIDTLLASRWTGASGRLFRDAYDLHELLALPNVAFDFVAYSPDGKIFVTGANAVIEVWDSGTGARKKAIPLGDKTDFTANSELSVRFAPSNKLLLTMHDGANIWDVETGALKRSFTTKDGDGDVVSVEFSPDSRSILIAADNAVHVYDVESGAELWTFTPQEENVPIRGAKFSPVPNRILTFDSNGNGRLWDLNAQAEIHVFPLETGFNSLWTFSPDGGRILSGTNYSGKLTLWNANTGQKDHEFEHPIVEEHDFFKAFGFSPDGHLFFTSTFSKTVVWDAQTAAEVLRIERSDENVESASFAPDGKRLLIVSGVSAKFWDIEEKAKGKSFKGQEGAVAGASINADGSRILTWSDNGLASLWDANSGAEVAVMTASRAGSAKCDRCDVRLSTAAAISARFPFISPHGNIVDRNGKIMDRVVDGGYFENFGAITALELANELKTRFDLQPAIILVNNEPATSGMQCLTYDSQLTYPEAGEHIWFPTINAPLAAVNATRSARGSHAAVELCARIAGNFAFVTVEQDRRNKAKALSMSWWLSKHIQKILDDQVQWAAKNKPSFEMIDGWIRGREASVPKR